MQSCMCSLAGTNACITCSLRGCSAYWGGAGDYRPPYVYPKPSGIVVEIDYDRLADKIVERMGRNR